MMDTTVQEKAIVVPTDSRLLDVARKKLVFVVGQAAGITLRQSCERKGLRAWGGMPAATRTPDRPAPAPAPSVHRSFK